MKIIWTDRKVWFLILASSCLATAKSSPLSPTALVASSDGKLIYVACATASRVLCFDIASRKLSASIPMPEPPSGLALSADDKRLYVTCATPESKVCIVDVLKPAIVETIPGGHTTVAPVLDPDGKTLYVCNRFNNDISVINLTTKKEVRRIAVQREPIATAITKDGKFLLVANLLHNGRADVDYVAATVSVIDLAAGKVVKELQLPNGSGSLKDIRVSPDGKYAVVTHLLAQFNQPTTHIYRGWMNANVMTIIDLARMEVMHTVSLDDAESGAANPWGMAWSLDNATLLVTHSGTHEISVINFPALLAKLINSTATSGPAKAAGYPAVTSVQTNLTLDMIPLGVRERVKLPDIDLGPRSVVVVGHTAYVANYFSDTLSVIDLSAPYLKVESIPLGPKLEMNIVRKGEFYFHDAGICFQSWQSCSSCHPGDARVDGMNWDLLNDGVGNPKNTKSLLLAHKTPPVMSLGVRTNAEAAVRAGIRHILFTEQPEEVPKAIDAYLKSLKPVPSPYLVHGKLSDAAKRGKKLFSQAGCVDCHVPGLYTDLHPRDVGTRVAYDQPTDTFYTPTLIEVWRTAPYLHTGSAVTIRDVLTTSNPDSKHANIFGLSTQEIDDLCEYVLSL